MMARLSCTAAKLDLFENLTSEKRGAGLKFASRFIFESIFSQPENKPSQVSIFETAIATRSWKARCADSPSVGRLVFRKPALLYYWPVAISSVPQKLAGLSP